MKHIDTDATSGAEIWRLSDDARPTDNIYGEQPYSSADGSRIALRHYAEEGQADGGFSILDLEDGIAHPIVETTPHAACFHGWSVYFYCLQEQGDRLILRRWDYQTLVMEDVLELPVDEGRFSYGTISGDYLHYAVCVHKDGGGPCRVLYFDLQTGACSELATTTEYYFKHEQFSRDGSNRLMIQANSPNAVRVGLGVLTLFGELEWLAVDEPLTPTPSGHEAWIGDQSRVFFSSNWNDARGNLWTVGCGDETPVHLGPAVNGAHVSVSACGRYWLVDDNIAGVPLSVGSFASGRAAHLIATGTVHNKQQSSHAHPYLTADNGWAIFTSNREGRPQVYGARIPQGLLASLD